MYGEREREIDVDLLLEVVLHYISINYILHNHNIETNLPFTYDNYYCYYYCYYFPHLSMFACLLIQEAALEDMKKELQARPTSKMVDDLRKKVKILQVISFSLYIVVSHWGFFLNRFCFSLYEYVEISHNFSSFIWPIFRCRCLDCFKLHYISCLASYVILLSQSI